MARKFVRFTVTVFMFNLWFIDLRSFMDLVCGLVGESGIWGQRKLGNSLVWLVWIWTLGWIG